MYKTLDSKFRKSALGIRRVNDLIENQISNHRLLMKEHRSDGKHNTLRIARAVTCITLSGGTPSLQGNSAGITGITDNGVGDYSLTLSASYFPVGPYTVRVQPFTSPSEGPHIINVKQVSATSVRLVQTECFSGAPAATDGSLMVAIHGRPVTFTPDSLLARARATFGLGLDYSLYNGLARASTANYLGFTAEHTAAGAHSAREIPKAASRVFSGGTSSYSYSNDFGTAITSVSRSSAGIVVVNLTGSTFTNNPNPSIQILCGADHITSQSEQWKVDMTSITNTGNFATSFTAYLYKRTSATAWTLTDGDFWFSIHSP